MCENRYNYAGVDSIGNHCSPCHAFDSHPHADYKHQIKAYIDNAGGDKAVERASRIAHATQNGRAEVVDNHERKPQYKHPHVSHGVVEYFGGSAG